MIIVNAISTIKVFFSPRNLLAHAMDKAWAKPQEIAVKMIFLDQFWRFGKSDLHGPYMAPQELQNSQKF